MGTSVRVRRFSLAVAHLPSGCSCQDHDARGPAPLNSFSGLLRARGAASSAQQTGAEAAAAAAAARDAGRGMRSAAAGLIAASPFAAPAPPPQPNSLAVALAAAAAAAAVLLPAAVATAAWPRGVRRGGRSRVFGAAPLARPLE